MPTTTGPFSLLPRLAWPAGRAVVVAAVFTGCFLLSAGVSGQEPAGGTGGGAAEAADSGDDDDPSRRVDESEESFRSRMELREQFRNRQPSNTTFSYSVSREGKLANLPPESQKHIREQLSDLVIESRLWEPGEDISGYPYEPSPAARSNAVLARQEREAWDEQLSNYQQREAAAHAAGSEGNRAGRAPNGSEPGAAEQRSTAATDGASPSGSPEGRADPGRANGQETHTAGVTESALDYLRQSGIAGAPQDLPGAPQDPSGAPRGSAESPADTLAAQAREGAEPGTPGDSGEQQADDSGQDGAGAAEPGTLDIADLEQLGLALAPGSSNATAGSAASGDNTGSPASPSAAAGSPAEPSAGEAARSQSSSREASQNEVEIRYVTEEDEAGTLDIQALRGLDPRFVGPDPVPAGNR